MDFMRLASGACCMSTDCIPSTGGNIQKKTTWKDIGYVTEDSLTRLTKLNQLKSVWEKDQEFLHKNCKVYRNLKNKLYSTDLSEFPSNPQWPAVFTFSFCGAEVSNKVSSRYGAPQLSAGLARQFEALYLRWQSDGFGHSHLAQMCFLDQFWD